MLAVGKIKWHLTLGKKLSYSETFGHMKLIHQTLVANVLLEDQSKVQIPTAMHLLL